MSVNNKTNFNYMSDMHIKRFKKIKKNKSKFKRKGKKKLSLFLEEKEEKEENDEKKESDEEEELEKKLNLFFQKIREMKSDPKNLIQLDFMLEDNIPIDDDEKQDNRRINGFIDNRSMARELDVIQRPRYNFLSPIKFFTKHS